MAQKPIIFAMANPTPEIMPNIAKKAGAVVIATGRSDFPNQVNNSLGFPAIFRGVLDVKANTVTDDMCIAAATELALYAEEREINEKYILPTMDDWEVFPKEAAAVAMKAIEQDLARKECTYEEEFQRASAIIKRSRDMTQRMMDEGFIAEPPLDDDNDFEIDTETIEAAY